MPDFSLAAFEHRAAILLLALGLDWIFGEPDWLWRRLPHPVVMFGKLITRTDQRYNKRQYRGRNRRWLGMFTLGLLLVFSAGLGAGIGLLGAVAELLCLSILLAGRSLDQHILAVARALDDNLEAARRAIGMIVGRRTTAMSEADISRAAIETGAENLSDGVIAPALWFLIGGLPGLFIYKMTNTADSMIGYRNPKYLAFGWAAARFDDLLNYLPARITSLLIAIASMGKAGGLLLALAAIYRDAGTHPSPNAGWPEAAMAGGLNRWLGGPRHYGNRVKQAAKLNAAGDAATTADIYRALGVMRRATIIFAAGLLLFSGHVFAEGLIAAMALIGG